MVEKTLKNPRTLKLVDSNPFGDIGSGARVFDNMANSLPSSEVEWLSTKEAAAFLKISESSLLNACSNGQVPFYKFQRRNRYLKSELHNLLLASKRK